MSTGTSARVLVVAKAPVPGQAKTRLGDVVGHLEAADLAAAALLDTIDSCATFAGDRRCHVALTGDLDDACRGDEIRDALASWHVRDQRGESFAERLANAHDDLAADAEGPVVQVGMDTPQLTPRLLAEATDLISPGGGVLGPATDGGWWLLGLADPTRAAALAAVAMSTTRTGFDTCRALTVRGVRVVITDALRDVDTVFDAELVAAHAPGTRFAAAWSRLAAGVA
jgi:glycosyltransferase A (GT-A) superfamily protein (DUF2064 family)